MRNASALICFPVMASLCWPVATGAPAIRDTWAAISSDAIDEYRTARYN
jgi:hypothetical protein